MDSYTYECPSEINNQRARALAYEESIIKLEELARKRFWTIEPEDDTRSRFLVKDQRGRVICEPTHLYAVRGFFSQLPLQA